MKTAQLLMALLMVSFVGHGAADPLIAQNAAWKYLDNGSDQGTAWRAAAFNDNTWATGNAELGYGDGDEATVVSFGSDANNKYITTYFRKSFSVANATLYSLLLLDLLCDDGAVVYLNGQEIYRQNMPSGTIVSSTLAVAGIGGTNETLFTSVVLSSANLLTGNNVLAVEIHQNLPTSSDISFNIRLYGQKPVDPLIAQSTAWKYLDNGTNQGTAWEAAAFNDNTWASGNAELGYGDGDEATVVSYGPDANNKYITTYFRKAFTVTNATAFTSLSIDLLCDDGAVVYLNGEEVYRQNMPAGTISSSTLALVGIGGTDELIWTTVSIPTTNLLSGNNVIAVEIHQNLPTSSDISFNMRLFGHVVAATPVVTRGAYLQMLSTNSIVIRWQTDIASDSKVAYGITTTYGQSTSNPSLVTEHEVTLTGLSTNTKYFYQIGTSTTALQGTTSNFFKTAIASNTSDFTVWATGDFGSGTPEQLTVRNSYQTYVGSNPAAFWIWLGDNAYPGGFAADYTNYVFNIYTDLLKSLPIFPALGNHDYANVGYQSATALGTGFEYFQAFTMPTAAELGGVASGTEKYYSYNYGNAHFIVIDSYGALNNNGSAMYNWVQSDLIANTKKWVVVYFHHPPYTKGTHDSDTDTESITIRQNLNPLFETYNVDLVLSGHSHVYERSFFLKGHFGLENTLNASMIVNNTQGDVSPYYKKFVNAGRGTVYAVCGVGGQGGYPGSTNPAYPHDAMAKSFNTYWGSMLLTFRADTLISKFLTSDGIVRDNFKIVKKDCITNIMETQASGNWNNTVTWGCGVIPTAVSTATINNGHTVTIDGVTQDVKQLNVWGLLNFLNNGRLRANH